MTFTIDGADLAKAISTVGKIVGKAPDSLVLQSTKNAKELMLRGASSGRYVIHTFKAIDVDSSGFKMGVPTDRLGAIVSRRMALKFDLKSKNGPLEYAGTSSAYKGHIEIPEAVIVEFPKVNTDEAATLSQPLRHAIFGLFSKASLSPQFTSQDMYYFIDIFSDNNVRVATGDNYHIALINTITPTKKKDKSTKEEEAKKTDSVVFPFNYVSLIAGSFDAKDDISMGNSKSHLHIFDASTRISLPLVAAPKEGASMAGITKYFTDLNAEAPDADFFVDVSAINLCLANMAGVKDADKSSDLFMSVKSNRLTLRMESKHGAISDTIDIDNRGNQKATLMLEPGTIQDVLARVEGNVNIKFFTNRACLLRSTSKLEIAQYIVQAITKQVK